MTTIIVYVPCQLQWSEVNRIKEHVDKFKKEFSIEGVSSNTNIIYLPTFYGDVRVESFNI